MTFIALWLIAFLIHESVNQIYFYRDKAHERYQVGRSTNSPPQALYEAHREWLRRLIFGHILNMTKELVTDASSKTNHARRIREKYQNSQPYQIGHVSSSIREKFETMLETYWYFQNTKLVVDSMYRHQPLMATEGHLDYYLYMQGMYHEINMEMKILEEIYKMKQEGIDPVEYFSSTGKAALRKGSEVTTTVKTTNQPLWKPNQKEKKIVEEMIDFDYSYD